MRAATRAATSAFHRPALGGNLSPRYLASKANTTEGGPHMRNTRRIKLGVGELALALVLGAAALAPAWAGNFSASVNISDQASAKETGIRAYPGAIQVSGKNDDPEGANLNFSFGDYGLKVVAVKLKTEDAKDKVADFYRHELARFGTVLDCTNPDPPERRQRDKKSREIDCEGDRAKRNGHVFKAGVKANQRVVSIEPKGETTYISLLHVQVRGVEQ
jgi:hypothetical protein